MASPRLDFMTLLAFAAEIAGAGGQIKAIPAGESVEIDIPDIAFHANGHRYDILSVTIKRAEELPKK